MKTRALRPNVSQYSRQYDCLLTKLTLRWCNKYGSWVYVCKQGEQVCAWIVETKRDRRCMCVSARDLEHTCVIVCLTFTVVCLCVLHSLSCRQVLVYIYVCRYVFMHVNTDELIAITLIILLLLTKEQFFIKNVLFAHTTTNCNFCQQVV